MGFTITVIIRNCIRIACNLTHKLLTVIKMREYLPFAKKQDTTLMAVIKLTIGYCAFSFIFHISYFLLVICGGREMLKVKVTLVAVQHAQSCIM